MKKKFAQFVLSFFIVVILSLVFKPFEQQTVARGVLALVCMGLVGFVINLGFMYAIEYMERKY